MRLRRDPERKRQIEEVAERNRELREARTPEQQLAILDERLGVEMGAQKERSRLLSQIKERLNKNRKKDQEKEVKTKKPISRSDRRKAKAIRNANRQRDTS